MRCLPALVMVWCLANHYVEKDAAGRASHPKRYTASETAVKLDYLDKVSDD
jgi:hypothetical protein